MINDETILKAKQADLPELFRKENIPLITTNNGSSFKCLCPFHDDKEPSLNLNLKDGLWLFNCFGCGTGGTVIDFVMKRQNIDFKEAVLRLVPSGSKNSTFITQNSKLNRSDLLRLIADHYHKILTGEGGEKGRIYLQRRSLLDDELIKTFKIGFSDGKAGEVFKEQRVILREEYGLFKPNYWETFVNSVVFPVMDLNGNVTDLYARRVMNYTDRANHCYNKGRHQGIFNIANIKDAETIILTEGIIDALSIYKAGFKNVTALYGTNGLTAAHEELFRTGKVKEIIFALDNDLAGVKAVQKISEKMPQGITLKNVSLPDGIKDMNELLVSKGIEPVKKTIEEAQELKISVSQTLSASNASFSGEDLIYQSGILKYIIRNASNLKDLDSLRFVITAIKEKETYTDRIDLYLAKSRKGFENAVAKTFNLQPAVIESDLLKILELIEQDYKRRDKGTEAQRNKGKELTEKERTEALGFLKSSHLIKEILEDITTLGYIGEEANKLLLYLCATSRLLDKAISVLIRSQSSSGKSYLIKLICYLFPTEDVHKWTRATQQALYYMAEDALKHKFLAIDEREGIEEAEYPIRSLQSEGSITLSVPIKNPSTGVTTTEQIVKEGPIAYVDGSTDTRVNPENANRCFEIYLDESELQTENIHKAQKKVYELQGLKNDLLKETIKRKHQNAQRLLKPVKVIIPYVQEITFPKDRIRTRRDHDRFLLLIACITFLHQYQREHQFYNDIEYIESTLKDYEIAYKIASSVIFNTFQELDKPVFDFYLKLQDMVKVLSEKQGIKPDQFWFTRKNVRQFTKLPDYIVHRYIKSLTHLEYLQIKGGLNGSRHYYKLSQTINRKNILDGLTKPSELRHKLKAKNEDKKQPA